MKAFVSTLLIGTAIVFQAQAQDEVFKVLASRGNITTNNKTAISAGKKLYKDEVVEISNNGFVGLVHKSGKTVELKTPGSYHVNDLAAKLGGTGSSVSERYANYVIQEVSKDKESNVKKNHQQYMAVTGAVTRATGGMTDELHVDALVPAQTDVLSNGHVTFHWHKVPHVKNYVVHIYNLGEETIFQKEVHDTTATLDFSKINFGKSKMCLWSVTAKTKHDKEHKSEKHGLQLIPAAKATEITKEVAALTADSDPKSSLGKIMMAAYYEDHNMYVDALHAYQEALKMEHNKDYQDMYHNFLYRAGLAEHPAK